MLANYLNKILINFIYWNYPINNIKCFFSKKTYVNHLHIYLFFININILYFLKDLLNTMFTSLIEITGVDITKLSNYNFFFILKDFLPIIPFDNLLNYNFINYKNNTRLLFNLFVLKHNQNTSLESIFHNANWLERELIEFLNIEFFKKNDTRNLLLDYNFLAKPLLKNFPTEGFEELYFNFENYSLCYSKNEFIEL